MKEGLSSDSTDAGTPVELTSKNPLGLGLDDRCLPLEGVFDTLSFINNKSRWCSKPQQTIRSYLLILWVRGPSKHHNHTKVSRFHDSEGSTLLRDGDVPGLCRNGRTRQQWSRAGNICRFAIDVRLVVPWRLKCDLRIKRRLV